MTKTKFQIKNGFTLIELLVVISVLGIIAAFVVARLSSADKIARDMRRKSDLNQFRTALECCSARSEGVYPTTTSIKGTSGYFCAEPVWTIMKNCIAECPADPLGGSNYYRYQTNLAGTSYILWAILEKDSSSYWYVCSNGVAKEKTSQPSKADCGF